MKVVHINTLGKGGAATAAYRIHTALRAIGIDSSMLVLEMTRQGERLHQLSPPGNRGVQKLFLHWNEIEKKYPGRPKGLELFSDTHRETDLSANYLIEEADIVHLHWVSGVINYRDLPAIIGSKKVVWTLHDMNPFTGGCHYAGDCTNYKKKCGACPQLGSQDGYDLTRQIWEEKATCYHRMNLNVVSPSRWLGGCVEQSGAMGRFKPHVIANGLPIDRFKPHSNTQVRRRWSIPQDTRIILFGADAVDNPRKGLRYFISALQQVAAITNNVEELCLIIFGDNSSKIAKKLPIKTINVGRIDDSQQLSELYAAADLFVISSIEDNLPNTAIEAMACGTPVVGFKTGGIVDIVEHKRTGYLAEIGNTTQMAEGIRWTLNEVDKNNEMRFLCRQSAIARFASQTQARVYKKLYEEKIGKSEKPKKYNTKKFVYHYTKSLKPRISNLPLISIVTPSYNQARFIEDCIQSVLNQNYPNIEYMIMDGGSTDGSKEIIERYSKNLAYWRSEPDKGQYAAIQEGINRSNGEIITWLNSDDQLTPQCLAIAASIFNNHKEVQWLTGRPCSCNENGKGVFVLPQLPIWSRERYLARRYHHPFIQQEGTFWRRSLWVKAGSGLNMDIKLAGDLELWIRFFRHAALYSCEFPLGIFRVHKNNRSKLYEEEYMREAEQLIDAELERDMREGDIINIHAPLPILSTDLQNFIHPISLRPEIPEKDSTIHEPKVKPFISAIISAYRCERFIRGCLEDLLAQTIRDKLEIIVVDSGSPEKEGEIVREFQKRHSNIKYVRTAQRESVYAAWNRGIKLAQGKYITNANSDDRHRPEALERMTNVLEANPNVALVYADVIKTRTENETFHACTPTGMLSFFDWDRRGLLEEGCFIGPQPVWRKQLHAIYGYFDETLTVAGDYEFWLRISQSHEFQKIPNPMGLYLEREESVEHANAQIKRHEERAIIAAYGEAAQHDQLIHFLPIVEIQEAINQKDAIAIEKNVEKIVNLARELHGGRKNKIGELGRHIIKSIQTEESSASEHFRQFKREVARCFLQRGKPDTPTAKTVAVDEEIGTKKFTSISGGRRMKFVDEIYNLVRMLMAKEEREIARWILSKLVIDFPDHEHALYDLAILAHAAGDMESAQKHFQRAAAAAPGNVAIQKSYGDFLHVARNDLEGALLQYQKVLALEPRNPEVCLTSAHLCVARQRFEEACNHYRQVLDIDPRHGEARNCLDKLATVVKRPTAEIEPLLSKARELSAKGDKVGAIGLLNQLIGREPLNAVAHNDLAVLYFETGSKELAQVHYERAAEISPGDIGILKNLADFYYFEKGETEKSMRKYLQALTLAPQDIETLLSISHICISVGQIEDSRGFLNRVIEIDPANKSARQLLNELSYVEPSNGRSPSEEDLYARAQKSAAQGDRHGAVADLREIVARNPDHAPAYNDLGVIHYELGEKEKALQFYEQAVRLEAHNATYLKNLADFYYIEQNRVQDALKIYNRLLEADNQDIDCLVAAGTICADLGKADDAHVFIDRVLSIEPWHQRAREVKRQLYALTSAADRPVQDWATPRAAVGRLP